ncbi:uncharacterized protein LOC34624346 [Cyclospora cayetanensis]|uniref:Uncharacterized protein LOC34624346 n=1 Tax=Cyclospora cayetanensis TaxID=88456 RepID=A0A6P6RS13_9EIME|nr:uncharacterized protein LOC34624346 [Cyclospora cayetanensis]
MSGITRRRWYLLRHAQSSNNSRNKLDIPEIAQEQQQQQQRGHGKTRIPDAPLTDLGRQQSVAAGCFLQHQQQHVQRQHAEAPNPRIAAIVASPMLRGVQTARELQKLLQVPVLIHPLLFEAGGLFEGERQAIESATSATATKVAANDAEGPQEERLGLTWEQLHEICPAAVVAPGVSWPPAEQGDASCGCLDKTALPRCGESSAASVSLGGGYSPEALRGGAPWWRGPRETFFGTLRRALLLVQWIDSWSAHAGSADGSAAPEVAEATGDEEAAAVSALKGDGALLVVGHGLLMDLLMKALVAGPAAGICSCTVLYEQERQLFEQLQHSECSLNALYMPQQQAVYFLSGNCSLSCIDVVIHPATGSPQTPQQQCVPLRCVSRDGRCCCCCRCHSCTSRGLQRTTAVVYWGRQIVSPEIATGHALGNSVVVSI